MNEMQNRESALLNKLIGRLKNEMAGNLTTQQMVTFNLFVDFGEPDAAIVKALNWSSGGAWHIPGSLVPLIEQWAALHPKDKLYQEVAKQAIKSAQRELVSA